MRIYYKIGVFMCCCKKNFVVHHDKGHDQGHDHDQWGGPGLGPGPPLIMIMTLIMTLIMIMTVIMTLIMTLIMMRAFSQSLLFGYFGGCQWPTTKANSYTTHMFIGFFDFSTKSVSA